MWLWQRKLEKKEREKDSGKQLLKLMQNHEPLAN